jgi:CBS domain containing-hemolysin-like protein
VVNTALQVGSECSRRFYDSLGLSPEWAPLSQIFLVLIFAEIAPMFAGRRYAEHASMIGVPILYFLSILLRPVIWLFDLLCHLCNKLVGSPGPGGVYLSREELQKILEEREDVRSVKSASAEFNTIVANIFTLKNKTAKGLMTPLQNVQLIPSVSTIGEMRSQLNTSYSPYLPVFHRNHENIVAIAYPRDLLRLTDNKRVRDFARPPWFITENNSILQILKQFRRNNQTVAVVLNEAGHAVGILTLDEIIDEIFSRDDSWESFGDAAPGLHHRVIVDRTFDGDTLISDFNRQFHVHMESDGVNTLQELVIKRLGHFPVKGESVRVDPFELIVEEVSILGVRTIAVKSIS